MKARGDEQAKRVDLEDLHPTIHMKREETNVLILQKDATPVMIAV